MLSLSTATRNQNIDLYTQPPCKGPLKGIPATYQSRQVTCSSQQTRFSISFQVRPTLLLLSKELKLLK
jgi:hypothetical protein